MRCYGAIIIGDEIMRGKRADKHLSRLIEILSAPKRGLRLSWARYLGDERERLVEVLRQTRDAGDVVFSFGGIGVTPDDHTRQAAALAFEQPLELNADAECEIRARMQEMNMPLTPARLELGNVPRTSRIIPNPVNRIPGFSCGDHHFLPGFPQMAWPMAEWVLDNYYADDFGQQPEAELAMRVWQGMEGTLLNLMRETEATFPGITVFSLPSMGSEGLPRHVELGVRGAPERVAAAFARLKQGVIELGYQFDEVVNAARSDRSNESDENKPGTDG